MQINTESLPYRLAALLKNQLRTYNADTFMHIVRVLYRTVSPQDALKYHSYIEDILRKPISTIEANTCGGYDPTYFKKALVEEFSSEVYEIGNREDKLKLQRPAVAIYASLYSGCCDMLIAQIIEDYPDLESTFEELLK
jgi:hypothetical protein